MKAWYCPTWNGDLRLIPGNDPSKTVLMIESPTPGELQTLAALTGILVDRGWLQRAITDKPFEDGDKVVIEAPLEKVGPVVMAALRPGPAVLTAVRLTDGRVEVCEHSKPGESASAELTKSPMKTDTEKELAQLAKKPAEAAVTVKRPTPSCPDCFVEAVKPATQVLLAFLTPEQHKTWAKGRYIVCRGGLSGHRYVIAHRSSEIAAKNGRICFDADDKDVLHFHDQSVPPEEEVLAAMLCLQHREPWLRNEATCFYGLRFTRIFKNPFGDHMDGVPDASLTKMVGMLAMAAANGSPG